jgi:hypothetical protein
MGSRSPSRPRASRNHPRRPPSASGRRSRWPVTLLALVLAPGLGACGEAGVAGSMEGVRDTLPNGAERIRYGALPAEPPEALTPDLRIGVVEGDLRYVFGQIRGIEADRDGRIYVLDGQAGETRIFGPDGTFRRAIARRGEGPGEALDPNGILRAADGTFWVQDPRRWLIVRLTPEGEEVGRIPMFVRQWGFVWDATVDRKGRIWTRVDHMVGEFRPPEPGFSESEFRTYVRFHDPRTEEGDSVFVSRIRNRGFAIVSDVGWGFRNVPWEPGLQMAVGADGEVWAARGGEYRIVRLDARGDTTLVIEAAVTPERVTPEDRERVLAAARDRGADEEQIARQILQGAREVKPIVAGLDVDDRGNLWVRRHGRDGEPPRFDVFGRDGTYLGSWQSPLRLPSYFPLRFREGLLYALALDDMDVQTVLRIPVPL